MRRLFIFTLLLISQGLFAQKVYGPFSYADKLMSTSFVAHAGKTPLKPIPPKPFSFERCVAESEAYISEDKEFIEYLLSSAMREDALVLLSQKPYFPSDTLDYLTGLALFDDRQFEGASAYFSRCSAPSAPFLGAFADIQTGDLAGAEEFLAFEAGEYAQLAAMEKAGIALIRKDWEGYRKASASFTYEDYRLADSQTALDELFAVASRRKKSPFVAAGLSAVIPGAGKIYSGQTGPGVAAFLTVVPLGVITAGQWVKNGPVHWGTILSGALFSIFYIGNIYGSYVSVGIYNDNLKNAQNSTIVFNLHVPVRSRL